MFKLTVEKHFEIDLQVIKAKFTLTWPKQFCILFLGRLVHYTLMLLLLLQFECFGSLEEDTRITS